jgi:hypothetical protein
MSGGAPAGGVRRVTVFAVGPVDYGVLGRIPRSLPLPATLPASILHDGAEFPVVDLPAAFGIDLAADTERRLFLVEEGAARRALLVDRLVGTETFDLNAVQPLPAVYPEDERRRWRGLLPRPDGTIVALLCLEGLPLAADAEACGEG